MSRPTTTTAVRRRFGLVVGFTCGLLAPAGPARSAEEPHGSAWNQPLVSRPNILFLLSDDQRPDTIGALGNDTIRTPHLDRLVREGTAFTRAVTASPICVSSRAEILTGSTGFHAEYPVQRLQLEPELVVRRSTARPR